MPFLKTICFFSALFICIGHLAAQEVNQLSLPVYTSASLFYDFPQSPGMAAEVQFPLNSRHIFINKKGKEKQKFRELVTTSNVGFYRYPFNNTGLFLQQSAGYRYHCSTPYFFECLLTVGALRTFYDGAVYSVSDEGAVTTLAHFGRWYAITGVTTLFGHDWERAKNPHPFAISVQPSLWIQYPYNSFVLPHFSVQLSLQYHFPSFNILVHQKEIRRGHQS